MMTGAIGRLLRLAAVAAVAGLAVGCASSQGPGVASAPPGFGKDEVSRVERLVQYCDRLVEKGEQLTALGLCTRAHEIDPDDPEPLMKIAAILEAMQRQQAAVQTYKILLERHPGHHEGQYSLARLYMESGEAALAALHFEHATRSDPQDPRPYNALGILRDQAGEHEAAQALYRLALEREPDSFSVRNNLGLSLALAGKRDEAIELLAELAVDPQAGQTVLRNLEAAYAARTQQPGAAASVPVEPLADPLEPVASEPLVGESGDTPPAADVTTMTAPSPARDAEADAPEAGAPTPLFVPPAAAADEPEQSGATGLAPPAGSAILAAAERLMQPPEWADFEPGVLMPEPTIPAAATAAPPPSDSADDAEFENTRLERGDGGGFQSALLLLETVAALG